MIETLYRSASLWASALVTFAVVAVVLGEIRGVRGWGRWSCLAACFGRGLTA